MAVDTLLERITDYANRPDPYPLYVELREAGEARQGLVQYRVGADEYGFKLVDRLDA
jgi:hypothetical protein